MGGMASRIFAIVTLAAPTNGTTAYDMVRDPSFDTKRVKIPLKFKILDRLVKSRTKIKMDGRDQRDWANWDMMLDHRLSPDDISRFTITRLTVRARPTSRRSTRSLPRRQF